MPTEPSREPPPSLFATLVPFVAVVFILFLVTGAALPVLPLHVHHTLGFSTTVVGLVSGAQFTASLLSRFWAGHYADSRGAKRATVAGLVLGVVAGGLYLLSVTFSGARFASIALLFLGRVIMGAAESGMVTGALSWALLRAGPQNTGKVLAWIGMAMYVAFAAGAPAGMALYGGHGFVALALMTTIIPLVTLLLILPMRPVPPLLAAPPAFTRVTGAVWVPGVGLALSSVGFGAIATFIALLYVKRGWDHAWIGFTVFCAAFVVGRLVLGHLPDKLGGARVAWISMVVEAAGQVLVWLAPSPAVALTGAALTGLGFTLVYPGLGVEAVRRAPPQSRGLAMGAYTAFLDLALGLSSPLLGAIAGRSGLNAVYLVSALLVSGGAIVALCLARGAHVTDSAAPGAA